MVYFLEEDPVFLTGVTHKELSFIKIQRILSPSLSERCSTTSTGTVVLRREPRIVSEVSEMCITSSRLSCILCSSEMHNGRQT